MYFFFFFFFFQAEDGIRDVAVTGVQTCALPISCNDASVQGEADASKASCFIRSDLYGPVLDDGWKGASARTKGPGAALQHRQAETRGRQADCRRHGFLSRPEYLLRNSERRLRFLMDRDAAQSPYV